MAETDLTQDEANLLIAMEKHREDDRIWLFPGPGQRVSVPLTSPDKREHFLLDVTRAQIRLTKATYQNRARQVIILMRLDLGGPPHRNPDEQEIPCPHLHVYREGYADKWAVPAPTHIYANTTDLFSTLESFLKHCNVTEAPNFQKGLF
jgi:Family of unknown function (DUF6978)